jgi:hypothetical protein
MVLDCIATSEAVGPEKGVSEFGKAGLEPLGPFLGLGPYRDSV